MGEQDSKRLVFREGVPADLPHLIAIADATLSEHICRQPEQFLRTGPSPQQQLLERMLAKGAQASWNGKGLILVCAEGDIVQGYAMALILPEVRDDGAHELTARVFDLSLRAEARGRGVGTALLGAFMSRLRQLGATRVMAEVWQGNAASEALFRSAGFDPLFQQFVHRLTPPVMGAADASGAVKSRSAILRRLVELSPIILILGAGAVLAFLSR